jgi:hypothetical protein
LFATVKGNSRRGESSYDGKGGPYDDLRKSAHVEACIVANPGLIGKPPLCWRVFNFKPGAASAHYIYKPNRVVAN